MENVPAVYNDVPVALPAPEEYGPDADPKTPLLPYKSTRPLAFMVRFGMKFPWSALITRGDGISSCSQCGAKYAGYQEKCTHRVTIVKYREPGESIYRSSEYKPGNWHPSSERMIVLDVREDVCGGWLAWDRSSSFADQVRFFEMLEALPADPNAIVPVSTYANGGQLVGSNLPLIMAQQFQLMNLQFENTMLRQEIAKHRDALNQIANKMNNAGHALSF